MYLQQGCEKLFETMKKADPSESTSSGRTIVNAAGENVPAFGEYP